MSKEEWIDGGEVGVIMYIKGRKWVLNSLLFAGDTVFIPENKRVLQSLVSLFYSVCKRRQLKVNVIKSKVMVCEWSRSEVYLGSVMHKHGDTEEETREGALQERKVAGSFGHMNGRNVRMKVKKDLRNTVIVPTLTYASKTWAWNENQRS